MYGGDTASNYQLEFDLRTDSGTIDYRYANDTVNSGSTAVNRVKCKSLNIPVD
jgi:hypothetical protein